MKKSEFVCVQENQVRRQEAGAFYPLVQRALLVSLEARGLITPKERRDCEEALGEHGR